MTSLYKKISPSQLLFLVLFLVASLYYLLIKAELYESKTALIVQDYTNGTSASSLGLSLLGM